MNLPYLANFYIFVKYKDLLDLEQRVIADEKADEEKKYQYRLDKRILVFTLVTVIFVGLSHPQWTMTDRPQTPPAFFATIFGLNARDWTGQSSNLTLHEILLWLGPLSGACVFLFLMGGFWDSIREFPRKLRMYFKNEKKSDGVEDVEKGSQMATSR